MRHWLPPGCALLGLLLCGSARAAPHISFLHPQGPVAAAQRTHFYGIIIIVMIVVLPVIVLTPYFAWRYRQGRRDVPYTPGWSFSWPLEFLIWGVPFLIVIGLAVWLWRSTDALDPYSPLRSGKAPLRVEVIGYDWKWLFVYPDYGIATIGQLAFPVDRPLALELTSDTVMQSFFVPALGSQIYAMAGMVTRLHLAADSPGRFLGEATQFDGLGFNKQRFTARAMTPAAWQDWLRHVSAVGIRLTPHVYNVIRGRSTKATVRHVLHAGRTPYGDLYFLEVSPQLFGNVVRSFQGGPTAAAALLGAREVSALAPRGAHALTATPRR